MSEPSKKPRLPTPAPSRRPKPLALWPLGMPRPGGPLRPSHSTGNMAKPSKTWRNKALERKAEAKLTSSLPVRLPYTPAIRAQRHAGSFLSHFVGAGTHIPPIHLITRGLPSRATVCPSSSSHASAQAVSQAQKVTSFPTPCGQHASGGTMSKAASKGHPSSKQQEIPPWNKVLKHSHSEVFNQDSDLVKEARKEYFSRHSYNFNAEGNHNLLEVFKWMALCHFNALTLCPWCGKESQNEGTVVNHLWTVHYRLDLVCDKCNDCPSTSLDTLCHHSQ